MKRPRGSGSFFVMSGPFDKRSPDEILWIRYCKDGKVYRESTGTNKIRKAESILQEKLADVRKGTFIDPKARRVKVDDLIADLLPWYRNEKNKPVFATASQKKWEQHLSKFFGGTTAEQMTTDTIRQYRAKRANDDPKPSPTTVNRELAVLRKAYKLAAKSSPPKVRIVPEFPMASEKGNVRMTFMTADVLRKLRDAASNEGLWARFFLEMTCTVGWRKGEVLGLTVGNVHLLENYIRIERTKNGDAREAALTESLKALVTPLLLGRKANERLFPVKDVRCAWRRICKAAGVKAGRKDGYVIHDGRRTAPRRQRAAGVAQSVSMAQMGWKSDAMYRRYGIVDRSDMRAALERVEQYEQKTVLADFWQNQAETKPQSAPLPQPAPLPN
jgi:integrase